MKRSPSPRTVLAHLLPETSTQNLLLFYLAILKLQPRATKTSRQGWRPSQRRSTSETSASMAVVLKGRRPSCGRRSQRTPRTPAKVYFGSSVFQISEDADLHLSCSSLSPFLLDSVRGDHHHSNPNISQPTHTHTRSE
jgi:hypothetical protein